MAGQDLGLAAMSTKNKNGLSGALLVGGVILFVSPTFALAQSEGLPSIRVEAQEVVVPAFVLDKTHFKRETSAYGKETFMEMDQEITGLSAKDFHVFEDGVEQQVQSLTVESEPVRAVADNVSRHEEYACTPSGIWACADVMTLHPGLAALHMYLISYVPKAAAEGSCHRIKVTVDHKPKATVFARDQYCSVNNFSFDSLNGTKPGRRLEDFLGSDQRGKLPLTVQAGSFLGTKDANRVTIAVEFPWRSLEHESEGCFLHTSVHLLGLVYKQDGTLATRFSDVACYGTGKTVHFVSGPPGCGADKATYESLDIPNHYETQIDLPAGDYELKLAITDGAKFGRVEMPLKVDKYDREEFGLSGVVLCKRFRHPVDGASGQTNFAPRYVPLVSKGAEFTIAGDTRFRAGDHLIAYFEVYKRNLRDSDASNLQFEVLVTDAATGDVKIDTGLRSAQAWMRAGNPVIAIADEIMIKDLATGTYKLVVRAFDSADQKTVMRETAFTVE